MPKLNVCATCHSRKIKEDMRSMKCGDCGSTGPFMLLEATAAAQLKPRATGDPNARPPHYRFATKLIGVSVALVTLLVLMLLLRR